MLLIDRYAYTNKLKDFNPMAKFIFAMGILIFSLINRNIYTFSLIILGLFILTVYVVQISIKQYIKLLLIPGIFLFVSIISIILSAGGDKSLFIHAVNIGHIYIGITKSGLNSSSLLLCRSISCLMSTYFLALTIPMNQLVKVFKILKLPRIFIELLVLIYRFIFIFLEESKEIYVAQDLKFGHKNLRKSYKSTGLLIKCLFVRVMSRYDEMNISLDSKLYNGEFYI